MDSSLLRAVQVDELDAVIALEQQTWHKSADPRTFSRCFMELLRTPWARGHVQIMGWFHHGRLVSSFRLHRLEMLINGHKRQCAGVGTVLTQPSERGQGHASNMIREALAQFQGHFNCCLLFSNVGPRFYKRLGFFPMPSYKYVAVGVSDPLPRFPSGNGNGSAHGGREGDTVRAEARPFQASDLGRLVEIYNLDVSLRKIGVLRSADYWDHLLMRERLQQSLSNQAGNARTYVCTVDDRIASYMAVRMLKDRVQIVESPAESYRFQNWMLHWAVLLSRTESKPKVEAQLPFKSTENEIRILVRRDSPLLMMHPLDSGLRAQEFPYPTENFLWSRDRF